jgi:hypothetical protein
MAAAGKDLSWALRELEANCFFDLRGPVKEYLKDLEEEGAPVTRWSFVPHPGLIFDKQSLHRYIVTIDTLSNTIHLPVQSFLERQKANITVFYAGGWADFLCDISMSSHGFEIWLNDLKSVLLDANAERFCSSVDELISIFRVTDTRILCGKVLASLA